MHAADDQVTPPAAREWWLVVAVTVAALLMRGWQLQHVGLSQFDEGVYAFSGWGMVDHAQPHRLFPEQQKFSPPVYFLLVALSFLLGGVSDRSAIMVNVVLGTLTVPILWWVARRWVGGPAAVAAATFLAFAGSHVQLSRVALTDVTFALTFLVALGAVAWALERPHVARAVAAGLAVGLAWNTKYHGWFALVIGAMTIAARWRIDRVSLAALRPSIQAWVITAIVATACYLPWMLFIHAQSGATSGWAAYFATMLRINWFGNLLVHGERLWLLESGWSRASVALAILAAGAARSGALRHAASWRLAVLAVAGAALGSAGTAAALSVFAIVRVWRASPGWGVWTAIAVVVLWVLMAPLYEPYFRLLLPLSIATYVLAGRMIAGGLASIDRAPAPAWSLPAAVAAALAIAVAMPRHSSAWRSARGLADAARAIDAQVQRGAAVAVIGEPPVAFYLHQRGHPSFSRTSLQDLDKAAGPVYFVTGYYTRRARTLREGLRQRGDALEILGRYSVEPSDLRLFDDYDPRDARRYRQHPDSMYDLVLYRYDPAKRWRAGTP